MRKSLLIVSVFCLPMIVNAGAIDLTGKSFEMEGVIKVKGAARCGAIGGGGAAESPVNGQ